GLDLAMSNEDLNLFSKKDDENNIGFAVRTYGNRTYKFKNWFMTPQFEFSFIDQNFKSIQRLRSVEFTRDFNLLEELATANQTYLKAGVKTVYNDSLSLNYDFHYLENQKQY